VNAAQHTAIREQLLERCQHERNELIALTAGAVAGMPRVRAWVRAARTLLRLLRILSMRPAATTPRS
jgi:hypothetical protein